MKWTTL